MADEGPGGEAVAALLAVLERVERLREPARGAAGWASTARQAFLSQLDALATAIGLVRAPVMLAERDAGTSQRTGDRSFESALGRASGKGFVEARREVRQAETLAAMPSVAQAVGAGGLTLAHVDAIARVASGQNGSAGARVLGSAAGQAAVVDLGRGRDAGEFQKELARYVAAQDPAAHERDHATQRAERFLVISDHPNGTFLKGRLDRFAGERLRLALEATDVEPDDDRDREQAMADALVALADAAVSGSGAAGPLKSRAHVSLLIRAETFAALVADQRVREGSCSGASLDGTPAPAVVSEAGTPVARSEVARILCDAQIARIVVDADDVPLSLGADRRLYTGAQRRAVIARDKSCAWPGCTVLARWAEVHHIRWWARDGGETSVENGVLLCEHHHHLVHQQDLVIERHTRGLDGAGPPQRPGVTYSFRTRSGRPVAPLPVVQPVPPAKPATQLARLDKAAVQSAVAGKPSVHSAFGETPAAQPVVVGRPGGQPAVVGIAAGPWAAAGPPVTAQPPGPPF